MASKSNHLMRTTLSVTLVIFVSKAIGFIREMIMAYYFGRDCITDAYNSAYSLFYLPELAKTMAQLTDEEKNAISHRGRAMSKIAAMLKKL